MKNYFITKSFEIMRNKIISTVRPDSIPDRKKLLSVRRALLLVAVFLFALSMNSSAQKVADIGSGGGATWLCGTDGSVYKWNSTKKKWDMQRSAFVSKIDVDNLGNPWVVDKYGNLAKFDQGDFQKQPGEGFLDLDIDELGTVWVVKSDGTIARFNPSDNSWINKPFKVAFPGKATCISVFAADMFEIPYVIDSEKKIHRFDGQKWIPVDGKLANDLSMGSQGLVWIVSDEKDTDGLGFKVYTQRMGGTSWDAADYFANRIDVGSDGKPWYLALGAPKHVGEQIPPVRFPTVVSIVDQGEVEIPGNPHNIWTYPSLEKVYQAQRDAYMIQQLGLVPYSDGNLKTLVATESDGSAYAASSINGSHPIAKKSIARAYYFEKQKRSARYREVIKQRELERLRDFMRRNGKELKTASDYADLPAAQRQEAIRTIGGSVEDITDAAETAAKTAKATNTIAKDMQTLLRMTKLTLTITRCFEGVMAAIDIALAIWDGVEQVRSENYSQFEILNNVDGMKVEIVSANTNGELLGEDGKEYSQNVLVGASATSTESKNSGMMFELHPTDGGGARVRGTIGFEVNYKGKKYFLDLETDNRVGAGIESTHTLKMRGLTPITFTSKDRETVGTKFVTIDDAFEVFYGFEHFVKENEGQDQRKDLIYLYFSSPPPPSDEKDVIVTLQNSAGFKPKWDIDYTAPDGTTKHEWVEAGPAPWKFDQLITIKNGSAYHVKAYTQSKAERPSGSCQNLKGDVLLVVTGPITNGQMTCSDNSVQNTTAQNDTKKITITFKSSAGFVPVFHVSGPGINEDVPGGTAGHSTTKEYYVKSDAVLTVTARQNNGKDTCDGSVQVTGDQTVTVSGAIRKGRIY